MDSCRGGDVGGGDDGSGGGGGGSTSRKALHKHGIKIMYVGINNEC